MALRKESSGEESGNRADEDSTGEPENRGTGEEGRLSFLLFSDSPFLFQPSPVLRFGAIAPQQADTALPRIHAPQVFSPIASAIASSLPANHRFHGATPMPELNTLTCDLDHLS